jgi:hypothetical protein
MAIERTHGQHTLAPQQSGPAAPQPAPAQASPAQPQARDVLLADTALAGPNASHASHGSHGSHASHGSHGSHGSQAGADNFDLSLFQLTDTAADIGRPDTAGPARSAFGRARRAAEADMVFDLQPIEMMTEAPKRATLRDQSSNGPIVDPTETSDPDAASDKTRPVGPGWAAMAMALGWVGAVIATPLASPGVQAMLEQPPLLLAALAALALLPPLVIVSCSAAVREATRARQEQWRLTQFARRVMLGPDEMEGRAEEMGRSIRAEIDEINASMIGALDRMAQLEAAAIRNAHAFEDAVTGARSSATALSEALNGERAAFAQLNADLQSHTENLGATVARQIRMMREASNLVRQETARADQSLTANIASLATSTAALGEKTQALDDVVELAAHSAQHFGQSMGTALHALAEATKLNDSASQSAETSALAAQQAAQAVRDAAVYAAADARRVTEIIRAETKVMQDQAQATLDMLRNAADEARRAAQHSEAAAARFTTPPRRNAPSVAPPLKSHSAQSNSSSGGARAAHAFAMSAPANDIDFDADLRLRILRLIADAGIDLETLFSTADLDYIAGRSRDGAPGRRRAVTLAAMDAVERIQHRLHHDARARDLALMFRSKPDLASSAGGRNALKAYLLVDAALG